MDHAAEITDEDWELEHYGLQQRHFSDSEDSEESSEEDLLYRHVHYNVQERDFIQTRNAAMTFSTTLSKEKKHFHHQLNSDAQKMHHIPKESGNTSVSQDGIEDAKSESDLNDIVVVVSDDTCASNSNDIAGGQGDKSVVQSQNLFVATDLRVSKGSCHVTVDDSEDSEVVVLKKSSKKRQSTNYRKTQFNEASAARKAIKIERNSYKEISRQRQEQKPSLAMGTSTKQELIVISDDLSESTSQGEMLTDSRRRKATRSSINFDAVEAEGQFFLDSKGMNLDDLRREKTDVLLPLEREKRKTKAMLKDRAVFESIGSSSSSDDDCIVIESCSEEEGMQVHFQRSKDADVPFRVMTKSQRNMARKEMSGRYYVQSMQERIRCHNCFEVGHVVAKCPQPPYVPPCILCGTRGHMKRNCPKALCFNCSLPGHQTRACPIRRNLRYATCDRCQMPGHLKQQCPDLWRQYHLTTDYGPITRPTGNPPRRKPRDVYCSNCSKKGHKYYDCHSSRFDDFVLFTYDEVCYYDKKGSRGGWGTSKHAHSRVSNDDGDNSSSSLHKRGRKRKTLSDDVTSGRDDVNEGQGKKRSRKTNCPQTDDSENKMDSFNEHAPHKFAVADGRSHHLSGNVTPDTQSREFTPTASSDNRTSRRGSKKKSKSQKRAGRVAQDTAGSRRQKQQQQQHVAGSDSGPEGNSALVRLPALVSEVAKLSRREGRRQKQYKKSRGNGVGEWGPPSANHRGGVVSEVSNRGFILNVDLLPGGRRVTQVPLVNRATCADDFPRSGSQPSTYQYCGTQKKNRAERVKQRIKHKLEDFRERVKSGTKKRLKGKQSCNSHA